MSCSCLFSCGNYTVGIFIIFKETGQHLLGRNWLLWNHLCPATRGSLYIICCGEMVANSSSDIQDEARYFSIHADLYDIILGHIFIAFSRNCHNWKDICHILFFLPGDFSNNLRWIIYSSDHENPWLQAEWSFLSDKQNIWQIRSSPSQAHNGFIMFIKETKVTECNTALSFLITIHYLLIILQMCIEGFKILLNLNKVQYICEDAFESQHVGLCDS